MVVSHELRTKGTVHEIKKITRCVVHATMKSIEPSKSNPGEHKPPPYPVEKSSMIVEPPAPDPFTSDLVTAVQYGYYDRVVELIEPDPSLASTPGNGNITLLHWAAINNRVQVAWYLLSKGAHIDAYGGELTSTPLHWAARNGKLQMVAFLVTRQAQVSLFDAEGLSSIHLASMFGHTEIVGYLVAKGEDVDFLDKHGMSPLMHAVSQVKKREPTQLITRLGARINLQNPTNLNTPLHYAILGNNREAIRILMEAGARTDIRNTDNESAYDLIAQKPQRRHLFYELSSHEPSNQDLPKWLQMNDTSRRLGTKSLPYFVIILVAVICHCDMSLIYKGISFLASGLLIKGCTMIFFDKNIDRYLPIAIAQASIFWLYVCYVYCFLQYVHVISFPFLALLICTYYSWTSYYLAQHHDPGVLRSNQEQQYRDIIQMVEDQQLDVEHFCTCCLIKRPLRSKHCRECHRCVSKFDHHCPWIDNCVGEKNLRYFVGFLFFTPLCLLLYLHGAYLYYRDHCQLFSQPSVLDVYFQLLRCSPGVTWLTAIAITHTVWISALCITILSQIATGYTTNEKMNAWRYTHMKSNNASPFSLGCIQNLVDLIHRRVLWFTPVRIDWTHIYSLDDFNQSLLSQPRASMSSSPYRLLNV